MFDKLSVNTIEGMKKIADHYGEKQWDKLAEECCELAIEAKRIGAEGMTPELHERFVDEAADVLHLLMQITRFVEPATVQGEIAKRIGYKVGRQLRRIEQE